MDSSPLHDRLGAVLSGLSYRQIGELTGHNAETARRYMQGQSPSVEFLAAVCVKIGVNGAWLLTGRGPMKAKDVKAQALKQANVQELLTSLAATIEGLIERVDRLEAQLSTMETRIRAGQVDGKLDPNPSVFETAPELAPGVHQHSAPNHPAHNHPAHSHPAHNHPAHNHPAHNPPAHNYNAQGQNARGEIDGQASTNIQQQEGQLQSAHTAHQSAQPSAADRDELDRARRVAQALSDRPRPSAG